MKLTSRARSPISEKPQHWVYWRTRHVLRRRDRLIAAINAIASDFACILTVTHVPHFKEGFQSRIEVIKTDQGSQLHFAM